MSKCLSLSGRLLLFPSMFFKLSADNVLSVMFHTPGPGDSGRRSGPKGTATDLRHKGCFFLMYYVQKNVKLEQRWCVYLCVGPMEQSKVSVLRILSSGSVQIGI